MKKLIALLSIFASLFYGSSALAGPSINQRFTTGTQTLTLSDEPVAQTFKPSVTGLSYIEIQLNNTSSDEKVSVSIRHRTGDAWDPGRLAWVADQTVVNGWNKFDFEDITVTKDDTYGIWVSVSGSKPFETAWLYSDINGTYPRGNIYVIYNDYGDGMDMVSSDANFKTYGTTPVEMVEEQTNPGSDKTDSETGEAAIETTSTVSPKTSTTTTKTGVAPSANVDTSILPPTDLTAEDTENTAKLSWKATTTAGIFGYVIFRSETAGSSYVEIGRTNATTLEYSDSTIEAGKTYYYVIRAFEGTAQSTNSNETNITTASAPKAVNTAASSSTNNDSFSPLMWYLIGSLAFLSIAGIILYWFRFRKKNLNPMP